MQGRSHAGSPVLASTTQQPEPALLLPSGTIIAGSSRPVTSSPVCFDAAQCYLTAAANIYAHMPCPTHLSATTQAAALVGKGGGLIPTVGLVVGLAVAGYMMYYNIRRAVDLKYDDGDWPGPKAWPGGMGLISFFAVTVFLQALVADISTKV